MSVPSTTAPVAYASWTRCTVTRPRTSSVRPRISPVFGWRSSRPSRYAVNSTPATSPSRCPSESVTVVPWASSTSPFTLGKSARTWFTRTPSVGGAVWADAPTAAARMMGTRTATCASRRPFTITGASFSHPATKVKRGMGDAAHAPSAARSERRLEGEPDARGHRVGVFRIACRQDAVENLGRVQRFTRCEVSTDDIERHVRGELPPEPDICLGTDVIGVALREGLAIWQHGPATGRVDTRVGVDLLGRPRRVDGPEHAERWGDGVRRPEAQLAAAVTVVADEAARLGHERTPGTVVLVTQAYDRAPRGVVARVRVERLEVTDPLAQVVPGLVARAVDTASFEEQRAVLEAADGVEVEGALLCFGLIGHTGATPGDRQLVTSTPLVEQRGIEAPGAKPPARVDPDGVTVFLERRIAAQIGGGPECPCRVRAPACEVRIVRI